MLLCHVISSVRKIANYLMTHLICSGSPPFARAVATGNDFLLHRDRVDRTSHRCQFLSSILLLLAAFLHLGAAGKSGSY